MKIFWNLLLYFDKQVRGGRRWWAAGQVEVVVVLRVLAVAVRWWRNGGGKEVVVMELRVLVVRCWWWF